jgi:hypothetical protein
VIVFRLTKEDRALVAEALEVYEREIASALAQIHKIHPEAHICTGFRATLLQASRLRGRLSEEN